MINYYYFINHKFSNTNLPLEFYYHLIYHHKKYGSTFYYISHKLIRIIHHRHPYKYNKNLILHSHLHNQFFKYFLQLIYLNKFHFYFILLYNQFMLYIKDNFMIFYSILLYNYNKIYVSILIYRILFQSFLNNKCYTKSFYFTSIHYQSRCLS